MDITNSLIVFQGKKIRRIWHNNEWHFSVVDIVAALTDSADAKDYWYRLKQREKESSGIELSTFCRQLKLAASDGKYYETDCANTESIFRIIQSIPSKKAEPFKRWLAKVGYERVQEIENPELAQKRMKEFYKQKGFENPPARCPDCRTKKKAEKMADRQMTKITCSNCGKEDEVPFVPRKGTGVLCRECFAKQRDAQV